ncbi:MAG TPA: ABC transporter ATP-binding protein [Ilumatobacteraceae bacterium]|jgi:NitT/TauT family transport system ATP-binding protein|nr:ABC transporter ATP-binding protein [Ilumatobacteraceae bacterium]
MPTAVTLRGLRKSFGNLETISGIDLEIAEGTFVSVIGPSGCGKSTLLRVVAGLETASSGDALVYGEPAIAARRRKQVAIVPQHPGLLPWRTVRANARLLLDINTKANGSTTTDPIELLERVGLTAFLDAHPHELSGGMQQRVALVRALALGAPLLAMDEPLAALDEITRSEMRVMLNQLVEGRGVTTIFVTHSISEAVALSDRVLVTSPRPARIVADIAIGLGRPRPDDVDDDPQFFELCSRVRHALQEGAR